MKTTGSQNNSNETRRHFLGKTALLAGAAVTMTAASSKRVLGANERLRFGVIGAGGRGNSHLGNIQKLKDECNLELVAICDTYRPRLDKAAEKYGAQKTYMDHKEMLADTDIDAVSIATPDHIHGYQAIDAIEAGKDVYCEKPVTHWRQFELTKRLAKVVAKSDQVFQLGTQGMSDGAWHLMRKLIEDGVIGQLLHAECGFFRIGDWGERGMPIDDPNAKPGPDLKWEAFLGDSPERPYDVSRYFRWRMYEDYAGGPATDLFPHSLTPVLSMLSVDMPDQVVAVGGILRYEEREVPDTYNMLIQYPERITVAVLGTQANSYNGTGRRNGQDRASGYRLSGDGTVHLRSKAKRLSICRSMDQKRKRNVIPLSMAKVSPNIIKISLTVAGSGKKKHSAQCHWLIRFKPLCRWVCWRCIKRQWPSSILRQRRLRFNFS